MTGLAIALRLAVLVSAFAVLGPLQALSLRYGWRLAEHLPRLFHRLFLRLFGVRVRGEGWPQAGAPTLVLANLQRTIFIDRARKTHTATVNTEIGHRLARGEMIVLFPEGTTSDGNRVL